MEKVELVPWTPARVAKAGDVVTIAGVYRTTPDPSRRWWQFWKPKRIATDELQRWVCGEPVE